jgi:NitT/TauT family transport system permease protein
VALSRVLPPARLRLVLVIALFAVWEAAAWIFGNPLFVSPPSRVAAAFVTMSGEPPVVIAVLVAMAQVLVAFGLSVVIGIVLGLVVGMTLFMRRSTLPIVLMLYATPSVVFVPLIVLWFGIGFPSKVVLGLLNGIFPIAVATAAGLQNVSPVLVSAARSMGASRRQVLASVIFPSIVPSLFTGMRLGMTATLIGVLLAELYVSAQGLGYYTGMYTSTFRPANVFALVGVISVFAIILNETARRAELRLGRWRS